MVALSNSSKYWDTQYVVALPDTSIPARGGGGGAHINKSATHCQYLQQFAKSNWQWVPVISASLSCLSLPIQVSLYYLYHGFRVSNWTRFITSLTVSILVNINKALQIPLHARFWEYIVIIPIHVSYSFIHRLYMEYSRSSVISFSTFKKSGSSWASSTLLLDDVYVSRIIKPLHL